VRRGQAMIPRADTRLEAGDVLHISVATRAIATLEKLLTH
jgi:Trk K+ transport system NAD-binding subunit